MLCECDIPKLVGLTAVHAWRARRCSRCIIASNVSFTVTVLQTASRLVTWLLWLAGHYLTAWRAWRQALFTLYGFNFPVTVALLQMAVIAPGLLRGRAAEAGVGPRAGHHARSRSSTCSTWFAGSWVRVTDLSQSGQSAKRKNTSQTYTLCGRAAEARGPWLGLALVLVVVLSGDLWVHAAHG